MSRFLGASSRGGIQSSSLSDGTLTMSNGMLEGVTTINGVPPSQISSNTALLGGVTSTLLAHGTSILSNANAIAALPNANNTIVEAATSLGTDAFDFLADDVTTDKVEIGTPFFPLMVNSSHIVLQNGVFRTDGIVVINENSNSNEPAETKLRLHGKHTGITLGVNELDNYIDFILHQSIPLTTGGYLAISGNGNADLVRFHYGGLSASKQTDFMGGFLTGVDTINGVSPTQLEARLAVLESYSTPLQLKANDGTEFVIQQTDYPDFFMEQRETMVDANGVVYSSGYENASLMLYQSNAQTTNNSGIKWTCTYTELTDTYTFTNVMDNSVKLGLQNSWYVTLSGNTNMNLITNTQLTLTPTGAQDEYTISQVIGGGLTPDGVSVKLASISYDLSYETIGGVATVTGVPMTWFEDPGSNPTKFRIRAY